jgi:hypothetical protein
VVGRGPGCLTFSTAQQKQLATHSYEDPCFCVLVFNSTVKFIESFTLKIKGSGTLKIECPKWVSGIGDIHDKRRERLILNV